MKIMSIVTAAAVLGGVGFASIAAPASAQGAPDSNVSITVKSSDLDLSRSEGATVMLQRIHNAAAQICGPAPTDRLAYGHQYNACMKQTIDQAVAHLGSPTVTAMNSSGPEPVIVAEASDRR